MTAADWPDLPYPAWRDTAATLQLWTQIVGKVRLALTPWVNHSWQVPFYVTARGAAEPDDLLLDFLSTTYAAAADAGKWNRAALDRAIGVPARVRPI
jgi:Family of unknown function (DUF5996)